MAKSKPLSIPVLLGLKGKGLDEAVRDTKKLSKQMGSLADTAAKAAVGFVAFQGARVAFDFMQESVKGARDLQVNLNGLQSVFGEFTPQMIEFGKTADDFGLSISEAAKASTFIGSVLKQSGFTIAETTELTQDLVKAAADLSLTFGYDVQEALLAITALFRGEYDPIEKFGVAMKQNEIEGVKLQRGLEGLTGAAERFVDQQIRIDLFFQRASDSLGAYERQQGTLRVAQDQLRAAFKNMSDILGTAVLPALADATAALIPFVEAIGPILAAAIRQVIPLFVTFVENEENIIALAQQIITTMAGVLKMFVAISEMIIRMTGFFNKFGDEIIIVTGALYGMRVGIAVVAGLSAAMQAFQVSIRLTKIQLRLLKAALIGLPIVGWIAGLSLIGDAAAEVAMKVNDTGEEVENFLDVDALLADIDEFKNNNAEAMDDMGDTMAESIDGAGAQVKDAVGDFYRKLNDEIAKQQAKLELESMGASKGLINMIIGSGEDWQRVFADVVSRGRAGVAEVQKAFRNTAAGFDEAMQEWEEKYGEPFRQFKSDAKRAQESFQDFLDTLEIAPSVSADLGKFEKDAVDALTSIEEKLEDAFKNEFLLEDSYRNLLKYARQEYAVLRQIERQRDELIARRDAAMQMIQSVNDSILSGARLVNVLRDVQDETEQVDIAKVVKKTVEESQGLREFEVIVTSAVVKPVEEVVSKSKQLVDGYRGIVERTRAFVQDMKALRALGLDPQLFNELVEAGVDAGGATARALIEGGSETVTEVNSLFGELNELGAELGEETAQVMYGQGEKFVNGIVEGLTAQAEQLEEQAKALAEAFTTTFEDILISGIEAAIAAAEAALARMPRFEGQPSVRRGGGDDDDDRGGGNNGFAGSLQEAQERTRQIAESARIGNRPPVNPPSRPSPSGYSGGPLSANLRTSVGPGTPDRRTPSQRGITVNVNTTSSRSLVSSLSRLYTSNRSPSSASSRTLRGPGIPQR